MKHKRKGISKKLRFEVFKRDSFCCAYCGQSPPAVVLEVDHVIPVSMGGVSEINNYVTACFDCNRGKSNIPLEDLPPQLSENIEVIKEKELQLKEYRKFMAGIKRRINKDIADINNIYTEYYPEYELTKKFRNVSLKNFLSKLPKHVVEESMMMAGDRIKNPDKAIKYFCGICWRKIKGAGRE